MKNDLIEITVKVCPKSRTSIVNIFEQKKWKKKCTKWIHIEWVTTQCEHITSSTNVILVRWQKWRDAISVLANITIRNLAAVAQVNPAWMLWCAFGLCVVRCLLYKKNANDKEVRVNKTCKVQNMIWDNTTQVEISTPLYKRAEFKHPNCSVTVVSVRFWNKHFTSNLQTVQIIKNTGPVLCLFLNIWWKSPAPTCTNAPLQLSLIPLWRPNNYHGDSLSLMQAQTVLQEKLDGLLATFSGFLWCII